MLMLAALTLLRQGAPLFYIKKTVGKNGKILKIFKFRTMENDSSRVTAIGKILRQTAMDELPQLLNIFKGEMSFVGPRPYGIDKYQAAARLFSGRLAATPGLTGFAQVFLPKHAGDDKVLEYDLHYIKKKSFILDLYIIFVSVGITLKGGWESTIRKF